MKKDMVFIVFFVVVFFLLGVSISQYIGIKQIDGWVVQKMPFFRSIPETEQDIIDDCSNLNLQKTAICLRNSVATFYFYNVTDEAYYDLKTLKEVGGDCYNYGKFYEELGKDLGFGSALQYHDKIDGVIASHSWAILWDSTGYCKLDMMEVRCGEINI